MIKAAKTAIMVLAVFGAIGVMIPAYCQEEAAEPEFVFISGDVVSVDSAKSTIVVKHLKDTTANTYENTRISVSPDVEILKEDEVLTLSDIKAGDKVDVECTKDASGALTADSIMINVEETETPAEEE